MGRKKKKTKARRNVATVAPERLTDLLESFEQGALESLNNDEMVAMCDHFEKDAEVDALLHLLNIGDSSKQQKSVKQALFRLKQRGHVVPDVRERSPGIRLTSAGDKIDDLPTLVHEPFSEGARYFFLPYLSGRKLLMLEVKFEEPMGLKELSAGDVTRSQFRSTVKRIFDALGDEEHPIMVEADSTLRDRKLWAIGHCIRTGRTGTDVDRILCSEIRWPDQAPPHPIESFDLGDVEPMTHAELNEQTRFLTSFYSQPLFEELAEQLNTVTESPLIVSEATEAERVRDVQQQAVAKWMEQWDEVALAEIFLDAALFRALTGNPSAAKLFRDVVVGFEGEVRRERIAGFLEEMVAHMWAEHPEEPDGSDETSQSGLIIP